jgi:Carboxypeptidase regulatory-like domain
VIVVRYLSTALLAAAAALGEPPPGQQAPLPAQVGIEVVSTDGSRVPGAYAALLLERPLAGGDQRWVSLEAGAYRLWLKGPRRGVEEVVPSVLARLDLAAGARKTLEVQVPSLPAPEPEGAGTRAGLRVLLLGAATEDAADLAAWSWRDGRGKTLRVRSEAVSGGQRIDLRGGCRRGQRLLLASPRIVAAAPPLESSSCAGTLRLAPSPRATVRGSLRPPEGEKLPRQGMLTALACGAEQRQLPQALGNFPFAVGVGGGFEVPVPAGCVDLTLGAGDLAARMWEGLRLARGEARDLGLLRLRHGGAVEVRVVSGEDALPLDGVQVEAVPAADLARAVRASFGDGSYSGLAGRTTRRGGWARLSGLPAGEYRLRLLAPGRSWPAFSEPLAVTPPDETFLPEVELPAPATVTVALGGGGDLLDAVEGAQVHAALSDRASGLAGMHLEAPVANGEAAFAEVPPGKWTFTLILALPTGLTLAADHVDANVAAGVEQRVRLPVESALYHGRVTHLGRGVSGSLVLTRLPYGTGVRITTLLDGDGEFEAVLPSRGGYEARISDREGRLGQATVPEVTFGDPDDEVEIEVPGGWIAGRVVDEDGAAIAGAGVEAARMAGVGPASGFQLLSQRGRSGPDGTFRLEGLTAGAWTVEARRGPSASDRRVVVVGLDEGEEGVVLELLPGETVRGHVVDARGAPVAGVEGQVALAPASVAEVPGGARWTSGGNGSFSVEVHGGGASLANFVLRSPEGLVAAYRLPLEPQMTLELPPAGGEVRLHSTAKGWGGVPSRRILYLVAGDGATVSLNQSGAATAGDGTLVIPSLAPGAWSLVRTDSVAALRLLSAGGGRALPALASFRVDAGGTVSLEVDPLVQFPSAR